MDTTENCLRGLLTEVLADAPVDLAAVETWWRRQRRGDEGLLAFLVAQRVLVKDATRTLDCIAKGYLDATCQTSLLEPHGLQRLLAGVETSSPVHTNQPRGAITLPGMVTPAEVLETTPVETRSRTRSINSTMIRPTDNALADTWPPVCGSRVGKYLLTERVGQGTSGLVFRAMNQVLNLSVAIKILKLGDPQGCQAALESLQAEARLLASLNHPNVVRLWDFESDPARPYLVMEYVEGPCLAELIKQSGRLAPDRAVQLILGVLDGLAAAWKLGIVHRDVKPHNILITRDGQPKLADLGLALVVDSMSAQQAASNFAGTAAYMAPEQCMPTENGVDFRADIYSLGATLYHAVTGQLPFDGSTARELMVKHLQERPIPPHHRVAGLPEPFTDVVMTMMAREADDRFQTADEVRTALKSLVAIATAQDAFTLNSNAPTQPAARTSGFWKRFLSGRQA